jgi:16S rRNA (uracil1498-N3)-methyltransferase
MARRLFFVERVCGAQCEISGERAHHLRTVLRLQPGQRYEVSDNERLWLAEVESVRRDRVLFRLIEPAVPRRLPAHLTLLVALVKFERLEWMLEKATELGAGRVVLVEAARCEAGLERAARKRMERWRRILLEASQQARRARLPELDGPVPFAAAVETPADYRFLLDEQESAPGVYGQMPADRRGSDVVAFLVGPEGGWTEAERSLAAAAGWRRASLGPLILRSETAAIAALAVLASAWAAP